MIRTPTKRTPKLMGTAMCLCTEKWDAIPEEITETRLRQRLESWNATVLQPQTKERRLTSMNHAIFMFQYNPIWPLYDPAFYPLKGSLQGPYIRMNHPTSMFHLFGVYCKGTVKMRLKMRAPPAVEAASAVWAWLDFPSSYRDGQHKGSMGVSKVRGTQYGPQQIVGPFI